MKKETTLLNGLGGVSIDPSPELNMTVHSGEKNWAIVKLAAVMQEVDWIDKGAVVVMGGREMYRYTSESQFISIIRPLLVKHGLVMLPSNIKNMSVIEKVSEKSTSYLTTAIFCYTFYDVDTGDSVKVEMLAQGADSTDKGAYKLATGALKYILRQTFLIGTGDDPEATDENNNVVAKTDSTPPLSKIVAAAQKRGIDLTAEPYSSFWKENEININSTGFANKDVVLANKMKELVQNILSGTTPEDALNALRL